MSVLLAGCAAVFAVVVVAALIALVVIEVYRGLFR